MVPRSLLFPACAVLALFQGAAAQGVLPLTVPFGVEGVRYRADVPTPDSVLGHRIGERHTRPHEIVEYVRAVADASNRVIAGEYGRTWEHRPLVYAVVTSPANHGRLEQIRESNLRLSEDPDAVSDADLASMPVVVQLHYNVHGNEASGAEAALLLLYHLAAGEGPGIDRMLDSAVVILDPLINPDGRDRFVDWANANRGAASTTDPQNREHNEPWPGGRTNHYLFDLNRDWLPVQHPETAGRLALFHRWRPQLLVDAHEMGSESTFFFQPGIPGRDNPNTPEATRELTRKLAAWHAAQLDRIGSLYYTERSFDDFYYGKGSTYPDVNGAVGILFEQASSRALQRETRSGILSFGFTIRNQLAASLGSLDGAVALRGEFLRNARDFYRSATELASRESVRAYLVDLEKDRTRAQAFLQMLLHHRIRIYELDRDAEVNGKTFRPGRAAIIPVAQPQTRLLKTILERVTTFEDSLFYDISAWTMPLAFGLEVAESRRDPKDLLGEPITEIEFDGGTLTGGTSAYAYVMRGDAYFAPRALYRILEAGLQARLALQPFSIVVDGAPVPFDRGAVVIPVNRVDRPGDADPDAVFALMQRLVAEDHVQVVAVPTGLTPVGDDFGYMEGLSLPHIAIASGTGTSSYAVGEIWHLLSERFRMPVSLIDTDRIASIDLSRYTTFILPQGTYRNLSAQATDALGRWVRGGGSLIALEEATRWVIEAGLVDEKLRTASEDTVRVPWDQVIPARGAQRIGGSIFEVNLDTTHPITFGLPPSTPVMRSHEVFLEPSATPGATVGLYSANALLSGYISAPRLQRLTGSAAVIARRVGDGRVTLIADNPNFRAFWYGANRLFLNAVFFAPIF